MNSLLDKLEPVSSKDDLQLVRSIWIHASRYCYPDFKVLDPSTHETRSVKLPYHNFEHAAKIAHTAVDHCTTVMERGAKVDIVGIAIAGLLHDNDFMGNLDTATERFKHMGVLSKYAGRIKNKEALSRLNAQVLLESYGVTPERIRLVGNSIQATAVTRAPRTLSERILVRSDLSTLPKSPATFLAGTIALVQESALLSGSSTTNPIVTIGVLHDILQKYTAHNLSFGRYEDDYEAKFHIPALNNIALLGRNAIHETLRKFGQKLL